MPTKEIKCLNFLICYPLEKSESLEEFYKRKFDWMPDNFRNEIGHFNVFAHESIDGGKAKPLPYKRRDFYKIMFLVGEIELNYADQVVAIRKQALFFSNPQIPYNCEHLERISEGVFCIFNHHFFRQFGDLSQYLVFQPSGHHVFELTDEQAEQIRIIYQKMNAEIKSDYLHKYDVLRNLVYELIHFAMKMQPVSAQGRPLLNASQRISALFLELLERQFPIDENHPCINFRSASDFANQLNVHVNHLNRAVKETTLKTSTQLVADRVLQEAKIMLKHSKWNVSEIAFALGFTEVTHFNNFFKKHLEMNPTKFRNI